MIVTMSTPKAIAPPRRKLRFFWRLQVLRSAIDARATVSSYSLCMARTGGILQRDDNRIQVRHQPHPRHHEERGHEGHGADSHLQDLAPEEDLGEEIARGDADQVDHADRRRGEGDPDHAEDDA